MKNRVRLFSMLLLTAALGACNWSNGNSGQAEPDITTDTLTYTTKIIKERANDCVNKADSACTVASITYPVFNGQQLLNNSIRHKLIMLFGGNNPDVKPDTSLQLYAKNFIKGYENDSPKQNNAGIFYTLAIKAALTRQDSSLTTLELSGYSYQGGAHGGSTTAFINWDTKANNDIRLKDVLIAGYRDSLTAIAETIFRQQEKLTPTASLANDYFFKDAKFTLNENFVITPVGLKFLYNQYEIKPYAAGQTIVLIPYANIKSLLKPKSVITQYLK
ncbi:DUF3298 and DUF4163 domain-containing protein [Mucilaginibacter antarcticus]|uniref:DUF3298 domain-containing protein n=1 Tax=Mucilaginibacter antarcticus TaxID=1855725 RepID=A0ABW5XPD1_9SPHI